MAGKERMRLTDAGIARLRPRGREYTVWDSRVAGGRREVPAISDTGTALSARASPACQETGRACSRGRQFAIVAWIQPNAQ